MEQTMERSRVSRFLRSLVCPAVATGTCVLLSGPEHPLVWWGLVAAGCALLMHDIIREA